uniref:AN1-type domain-containing protein n=1 Tax=Cryptomonas curvata TaxID=233186 RepID=A0A6T8BBK0_9CRYP|mmetsp:Transcript_50199/g.104757  ORF Transcript_50199/g.104757 Transcript_50199/m.104757 type:complete len:203 (+) Transcript_50199:224-832(+)
MDSAMCKSNDSSLCAGGCGFFGSAPLNNMCSVCFKRSFGEDEFKLRLQSSAAPSPAPSSPSQTAAPESALNPAVALDLASTATACAVLAEGVSSATSKMSETFFDFPAVVAQSTTSDQRADAASAGGEVDTPAAKPAKTTNRCTTCSRKVGLTGFGCRCGGTFCSTHRYSDRHECSFDYKAAGRDALTAANPVVIAERVARF